MPVTITLPHDYTASEAQLLSELLERDISDNSLMRKLLKRLQDSDRAVRNLQDQANRDRVLAADLLRQRDEARADAKANDEEYISACKQRDELGAQLRRRTEWHEETTARLAYMRRQHAYLRDEAERIREDEVVSAELGRNVTDLPF